MDHPLISINQAPLRKRMVRFLRTALAVQRSSNIIFLCGGNNTDHMRTCFRQYCECNLPEYEVFMPESAMESIFTDDLQEPFDLTDFEELVGEISYAIVVFPEGPGSYAETGYFSAIPILAQKCILVLDVKYQKHDSFISLGPGKKISEKSVFFPNINLNYLEPHFDTIAERIRSRRTHKTRKSLPLDRFSDLSSYEIVAVLDTIVRFCTIATPADILFLIRSIFENRLSKNRVQKLLSILVGSRYLLPAGVYGHLIGNSRKPPLAIIRDGYRNVATELRLSLAEIYQDSDPEFLGLIEKFSNAN